MTNELEKICKEVVVAHFKTHSRHSSGRTGKGTKKTQNSPVSRAKFGPDISRIPQNYRTRWSRGKLLDLHLGITRFESRTTYRIS
jgi:hypothetical protein